MKTVLALAAILLVLAGCGSDEGVVVTDPPPPDRPLSIPAAPGQVRTLNIATVMDTGSPELCLGPVAESYPPQCSGPPIDGWDWADHRGTFDSQGDVRWGSYAVTGTWDGTTFGYTEAITAALYDPMPEPEPTYPTPTRDHTDEELADIAADVGELPGVLSFYASEDGNVLADVVYDDGSLQQWADEQYGDGVVVLTSMLVDVQG